MKTRILLIVLLAFGSFAVAADKKSRDGFEVALGYGTIDFNSPMLDEGDSAALSFSYNYDDNWALELIYAEPDTVRSPNTPVDVTWKALRSLYHLYDDDSFTPYLSAGIAETDMFGYSRDLVLGVGVKAYLGDNMTFRIETNYHSDMEDTSIFAFLGYRFGESKPAKAAPKDSDMDGVMDNVDACPKTPVGKEVDERGCMIVEAAPVDTDGDGVMDPDDQCPGTPAGALIDESGCQKELEKEVSVNLAITFATSSDVIDSQFDSELARVAEFMKQYPGANVVIEGHTDSTGRAEYNQALSERRAASVAAALSERFEIDASRISSIGYGETQLIASDDTAEGRQANRRVVAVISQTVSEKQWQN